MSDKEFKSIPEQIELLRSRGLLIEDDKKACDFLLRNNYYRISGYLLTLRSHDRFHPSASFQDIMDIYWFDHHLKKFMHSMTIIRNLCAHGSRLYNRLFEQKPCLSKAERKLLRKENDGSIDNAHLFGFILIMRRLLKPDEFSTMLYEIVALTKKFPFVMMKYYGFPDNWEQVLK